MVFVYIFRCIVLTRLFSLWVSVSLVDFFSIIHNGIGKKEKKKRGVELLWYIFTSICIEYVSY